MLRFTDTYHDNSCKNLYSIIHQVFVEGGTNLILDPAPPEESVVAKSGDWLG